MSTKGVDPSDAVTADYYYANLTNGIEMLHSGPFVRIQSTACEQKRWSFIIEDLENDLLLHLARGYHCVICDCGHNGEPRALWQGLPWIRYVLERVWLGHVTPVLVRGHNVENYFAGQYEQLSVRAKTKLRYFRRFLATTEIFLRGQWRATEHDGQYHFYAKSVTAHLSQDDKKAEGVLLDTQSVGIKRVEAWNIWAKRFNGILDGAFETTFADFLGEAVHGMYRAGWSPELAAKAFIWTIHKIEHFRPVAEPRQKRML